MPLVQGYSSAVIEHLHRKKLGSTFGCYFVRMGGRHQKNPEEKKLTTRQRRALISLAAGSLHKSAAREAGVHPQCVSAWLREPHFRAALDNMRQELVRHAVESLNTMMVASLRSVQDVLDHGTPALQLRAAMFILDRVLEMQGPKAVAPARSLDIDLDAEDVLAQIGIANGD